MVMLQEPLSTGFCVFRALGFESTSGEDELFPYAPVLP